MAEERLREHVWWGRYAIPEDQAGLWRIGPVSIRIERSSHEWVLACDSGDEGGGDSVSVELPVDSLGRFDSPWKVARFGMSKTDGRIVVTPALADRPVVIRPEVPFHLLPKQDVSFYVSSPLWFRIETLNPLVVLQDIPIHRPSDTWFGPSPKEGEFCYANRVYGKLKLDSIRFRPQRCVTVVSLKNHSSDSILIERLKLPAPNLSLYEGEYGWLWSEALALEVGPDRELSLHLREKPPSEVKSPRLVAGPRQKMEKHILTRALSYLIN